MTGFEGNRIDDRQDRFPHHWILTGVVDIWVRVPVSMNLDVDPQLDLSRVLRVVSRERSSLGSIPGIIQFIEIIHHWILTGVVDIWVQFIE